MTKKIQLASVLALLTAQTAFAAALRWDSGSGFRFAPLEVPRTGKTGFTLLAEAQTGIVFTNHLKPLTAAESGVALCGEQRGAALCDYDADGRIDLAVSQNGAATKLFHNERATPGLRVRLRGPAGNGSGSGAVLRWGNGPAPELHAGSGYWSQDSAVAVLARPGVPATLAIRWPGGRSTTSAVPAAAKEILVSADGQMELLDPCHGGLAIGRWLRYTAVEQLALSNCVEQLALSNWR